MDQTLLDVLLADYSRESLLVAADFLSENGREIEALVLRLGISDKRRGLKETLADWCGGRYTVCLEPITSTHLPGLLLISPSGYIRYALRVGDIWRQFQHMPRGGCVCRPVVPPDWIQREIRQILEEALTRDAKQ